MYTYSITPLSEDSFDEICSDARRQYEEKICSVIMFKMTLVPEGNPVWDKASKMCELYARYRDALEVYGVKCGVLIQASLGHGYKLVQNPFQNIVNLTDGKEIDACCPLDPDFLAHFSEVVKKIASERPAAIMFDDDCRLMMRPFTKGCACHRHMERFKKLSGSDMTREKLYEYVCSHPSDDEISVAFETVQRDSMVEFFTEMRKAIDSVDPSIQGVNCTSGDVCESVMYTAPVFAGKTNPTIVRVPNGTYAPENVRGFSDIMRRAAVCRSKLAKAGIDVIIAEADTIPFNRYGKNARYLHSQYTASILEGLKGAKHWISRFSSGELASGEAYRKILAKHAGFYEKLSELADKIEWMGINSFFKEQKHFEFFKNPADIWMYHQNDWIKYVIERMGFPFYYAEENKGAAFLEGDLVPDLTDGEIEKLFEGSVFADGESAYLLCKRGFGKYLGVDVIRNENTIIGSETFDGTLGSVCTKQKNPYILTAADEDTEVLSNNCRAVDGKAEIVSPAVTVKQRENGRITVTYCGGPKANFDYMEGFAFLNETRKKQFVSLFKRAGVLPVYYTGDNEILLRAGRIKDGRMLVSVYNLSYDVLDELELYLEKAPKEIKLVTADGNEVKASFEAKENSVYLIDTKVEPLYPVILLIK